ncbi:hypothetical protein GMORB2_6057, partial [Geosmithia morbida]
TTQSTPWGESILVSALVFEHNKLDDYWTVVEDGVWDVAQPIPHHPGGASAVHYGQDQRDVLHCVLVIPNANASAPTSEEVGQATPPPLNDMEHVRHILSRYRRVTKNVAVVDTSGSVLNIPVKYESRERLKVDDSGDTIISLVTGQRFVADK